MDDKRYSPLAYWLMFFVCSIAYLLFTIILLVLSGVFLGRRSLPDQTGMSPVSLVLLGWLPGLVVDLVASIIGWLKVNRLTKIHRHILFFCITIAPLISPIIVFLLIFLFTNHGNH